MKKLKGMITVCILLVVGLNQSSGYSQNAVDYSPWFYIQTDKAVLHRFALVKQEGDFAFYKVQFRVDFESPVFNNTEDSEGYVVTFSYPDIQERSRVYNHLIFYNSFKEIHTMKDLMPIRTKYPDGSKGYLSNDYGFIYETGDGKKSLMESFNNCVDIKPVGRLNNRCHGEKAWRYIFNPDLAVILK